jgi:hypothetical protein
MGSVVEIPVNDGGKTLVALVDAEDAHLAEGPVWQASTPHKTTYATRLVTVGTRRRKRQFLHRAVLGVTDTKTQVDHKDGNGLDCRKENLRIATRSQNCANSRMSAKNKSGYRGVFWFHPTGCWRASISIDGKKVHIGEYAIAYDAALAYDFYARKVYGEFARLNVPDYHGPPPIARPKHDARGRKRVNTLPG